MVCVTFLYSIIIYKGTLLTLIADSEWFDSTDRIFPVTIDPTLNLEVSTSNKGENLNMYISFVEENDPTQTAQGGSTLYVGYGSTTKELRGYIHMKQIPDLPVGSIITQANLSFFMGDFSTIGVQNLPIMISAW